MLFFSRSPRVRPLTLGLELELVAFGSHAQVKMAINRLRPLINAIGTWSGESGEKTENTWLVHKDTSIAVLAAGSEGVDPNAVEIISPVLKDNGVETRGEWRPVVSKVIEIIEKEPIKIVANEKTRTGFHVHVGVGVGCEFTLDEVKKVCMLFIVYESHIDLYHARHRSTRWFSTSDREEPQCKSNRRNCVFGDLSTIAILDMIRESPTREELIYGMCPLGLSADGTIVSADRQYKLNLLSLEKHQTLEFRQHEGTTQSSVVCGWADFVLDFVRSALRLSFDEIMEHLHNNTPLIPNIVRPNLCPRRDLQPRS